MATFPQAGSGVPNPSQMRIKWAATSMVFQSELTSARQRVHQWGRWEMEMSWAMLDADQAMPLVAFLGRYQASGYFTLYDPARVTPRGTGRGTSGAPVGAVNGASQTGRTLVTDGWPINQAALFKPGDLIGMGTTGEVYEILEQASSNNLGQATLSLAHPILVSPANNEAVIAEYVPFRMEVLSFDAPDVRPPALRSVSCKLVEHQLPQ